MQEKAGFIPNVFLAFARRPAEWRAFFAYHDALMLKEEGSLTGEREMIVTTTSAANQCLYTAWWPMAPSCASTRKKPLVADQVAVNYRKADISPRQRAMLDFAMKVCQNSHAIEETDFTALHAHGFDDEDIWDIAAITAFFGLSNRMASFAGMVPNPSFTPWAACPKQRHDAAALAAAHGGQRACQPGLRGGSGGWLSMGGGPPNALPCTPCLSRCQRVACSPGPAIRCCTTAGNRPLIGSQQAWGAAPGHRRPPWP